MSNDENLYSKQEPIKAMVKVEGALKAGCAAQIPAHRLAWHLMYASCEEFYSSTQYARVHEEPSRRRQLQNIIENIPCLLRIQAIGACGYELWWV